MSIDYSCIVKTEVESVPDVIDVEVENVIVKKEVKIEQEPDFQAENTILFPLKQELKEEVSDADTDGESNIVQIKPQERHDGIDTSHTKADKGKFTSVWQKFKSPTECITKQKRSLRKLYNCPECERTFKYWPPFQSHVRNHSRTEPAFNCGMCPFTTNNQFYFQNHKRTQHRNRKVLSCKHCSFLTYSHTSLTQHSVIHKNFEKATFGLFS